MMRKVYDVDSLLCSKCGGQMKVIASITDYAVAERIINCFKVTFAVTKPPPPHFSYQKHLMTDEASAEYF
jgi:hypothetical protein